MDTREQLFLATNKKGDELNNFLQENDPVQVLRKYDWAERRADKINGYVITFILPDEVFAQDGSNSFSAWLPLSIIADPRCEMSPDSRGWLRHNYVKSLEEDDSMDNPTFEERVVPSRLRKEEVKVDNTDESLISVITNPVNKKIREKPFQIRLGIDEILSLQILKERLNMTRAEIIRRLLSSLAEVVIKNKDAEYYAIKFELNGR